METLLSHVESIPRRSTGTTTAEALGDEIAVLGKAISILKARIADRIADQRSRDPRPGGLSLTGWTALNADMSHGEARHLVALAHTMVDHPATDEAIAAGSLSHTRARLLARAAQRHRKAYERDEEVLLGLAGEQSIADLAKTLRYWHDCADDEMASETTDKRSMAYLHASVTFQGMVRIDGLLDPETGEALLSALDAATAPPTVADTRHAPHRRAHALGEICQQWLRNGTVDGGLRSAVTLTIDIDTLQGRHGTYCELTRTGPIDRATALRILCDSDVTRVVTRGRSEILDVGRATRVPSPAQRKALVLRDRHCRFTGCDRPPHWCDAHHIEPWARGGPTDLPNLLLVCRHHHTLIHQGRATVRGHRIVPVPDEGDPP